MPAEIVVMEDCASNYGVFKVQGSKPDTEYTVVLYGSEGPARCDCPAFKFFKGPEMDRTCKHISSLWGENGACLYNPQWKTGNPDPKYRPTEYTYEHFTGNNCPCCGGPLVAVRRAV